MATLYCARWVLPVSSPAIAHGAIAVEGQQISAVGSRATLAEEFPQATIRDFGESVIIPGLVNAHSHLELTAMRGFLENEETDFFAWLRKLTAARMERLTADDLNVSAAWGAAEAARAGVTCVADASDSALESMNALRDVGLRGIVFQESFGPDPRLAKENFEKLKTKVARLRERETSLVKCGVSPHAPYTVCATQLELIAEFSLAQSLPMMMHAAETTMELSLLREGRGPFADGLRKRGIEWQAPGVSTIQYLHDLGVLQTRPLLAHCIHVDETDLDILERTETRVAHCAKSNAKLGHGRAPFGRMMEKNIAVGLGSDSVASNNTCDLLDEARFALLLARSETLVTGDSGKSISSAKPWLNADDVLRVATLGGARALGREGQIGELRAGLQADFAVVSLEGPYQIPSYDVGGTLIFASSGRDVISTVVAGREVYRDGRVTTVDENRLRARMKEISEKLAS
ncbi:MAG TPA: amidohydrolase family protein [Pyrinomonadaceae bacterium]|jgi:5-methylthioadenosine/S-adenosylhomocysteine deaminase|nr:amidohydrolase family protein [Pyrinomonadaceae bacterium]